jgi:transposase
MADNCSLDTILSDLKFAGFKDLMFITDCGYETISNLEKMINSDYSLIMFAKIGQKEVAKIINDIQEFGISPEEMVINSELEIYYKQYDIDYRYIDNIDHQKHITRLVVNLYFDPIRRCNEIMALDQSIQNQKNELDNLFRKKSAMNQDTLKRDFFYFKVVLDPEKNVIVSFKLNENKVNKCRKHSGFFSIITHGVDFDAKKTLQTYRIRDEQEKNFQQMKDQMVADRQQNWSEDGKTGRLFILFVTLIMGSYLRHIWKSTELKNKFSSSLEILDEMRSIRCIEHGGKIRISPFIGAQVNICEEFGFSIPEGCCSLKNYSNQKPKRKRGRPPKDKSQAGSSPDNPQGQKPKGKLGRPPR